VFSILLCYNFRWNALTYIYLHKKRLKIPEKMTKIKRTKRQTIIYRTLCRNLRLSNTNPTKTWGWTQILRKDIQFLLHTWHPSCYSLSICQLWYTTKNEIKNCKMFNIDNLRFSIMSMIIVTMILYCLHS